MNVWTRRLALVAIAFACTTALGQEPTAILFKDVRIFDGVNAELKSGHVLVEGEKIAKISSSPISVPAGAVVLEGNNRILSPGFIDIHAHLTFSAPRD